MINKKSVYTVVYYLLFAVLYGCNNNHGSVLVAGTIFDSSTNIPIRSAKVTILCWKEKGFDDVDYYKKDTTTDENGMFKVRFKEGYKIDVASIADGYNPLAVEVKNISLARQIILKLRKTDSNPDNLLYNSTFTLVERKVFNLKNELKKTESIGYNLLGSFASSSKDSVDLIIKYDANKRTSILSFSNGGIVPIYQSAKAYSAPVDGYVQKYILTGKEIGFFIRCKDGKTYAKAMIISSQYDKTSPYLDGFYKDNGITFYVVVQRDGSLDFSMPINMSLEDYILENI